MQHKVVEPRKFVPKFNLLVPILMLFALLHALPIWAVDYRCEVFDPPGSVFTYPFSMNDSGVVVVDGYDANPYTGVAFSVVSFLYDGETFEIISMPESFPTSGRSINDNGAIAGFYRTATNSFGFIHNLDAFNTIEYPEALDTQVLAMNNFGWVTGNYRDAISSGHPFLFDGTTYLSLNYSGGDSGTAWRPMDINDNGTIVGYYPADHIDETHLRRGMIYSGGIFSEFNVPGSIDTVLFGINDTGIMVGNYIIDDGELHGHSFIYDGNQITIDPCPEMAEVGLHDINDRGQLLGSYVGADGNRHGFIATPVTEAGDVDGSGDLTLSDAILALKIVASESVEEELWVEADVNGDVTIGIAEAVFVLQTVSKKR